MMSKRGFSLIESVIAVFIVSLVILGLMAALNGGIIGTLNVDRKTSALNLAKSQLEYTKAQPYNASAGNLSVVYDLSEVYGLITGSDSGVSDLINYGVNGSVEYVNNGSAMQRIIVNVSYLPGKTVQLIGYKSINQKVTMTHTYTFASGNGTNKWAWEAGYDKDHIPANTSSWNTSHPANAANYSNIGTNNSFVWTTNLIDGNNNVNTQMYNISISENRATITDIGVAWRGNCTVHDNSRYVQLQAYNVSSKKFDVLYKANKETFETTLTQTISTGCSNYISPAGSNNLSLFVLAENSPDTGGNGITTNYLELTITYKK